MRARIDVSEIEAQTKIRAKYLRALENEEWGLLPGPTFVKSFLRTYAQALGLDGKALVEEYRLHHERPSEGMLEPIVAASPRRQRSPSPGGSGPSRGYTIAVGTIGAVIVLLIVLLVTGGGGGSSKKTASTTTRQTRSSRSVHGGAGAATSHRLAGSTVTLSLRASGVVYVCLIGDGGRKLIPGVELHEGETTRTYVAKRFLVTLGNNAVTMVVDSRPRTVEPSSHAIGYSVTKARGRQPLAAGELPTCQ